MKQKFRTLVKKEHKLGNNLYVFGRVTGMALVICERDREIRSGIGNNADGKIFIVETTEEQYADFVSLAEKIYPGLCEFYYNELKGN